jgi:hypothetical protein
MAINGVDEIPTSESARWDSLLPDHASVFCSSSFAHVAARFMAVAPRLLVSRAGHSRLIQVVWPRALPDALVVGGHSTSRLDLAGPPYSGHFLEGAASEAEILLHRARLLDWCSAREVVAEFGHLHPWDSCTAQLFPADVFEERAIVLVDLSLSESDLWANSFTYACRKNIRRSERDGVRVWQAESDADLHEFHRIYVGTMDRNNAQASYYFPVEFFHQIRRSLGDHARFNLASVGDKVVAGTLYLRDRDNAYSYLGGADIAFQNSRPTNAIVWDAIRWAKSVGCRRLILGGGYSADDGIFRFKCSFSPLREAFKVLRRVHSPTAYEQLCARWQELHAGQDPGAFFPAYRAAVVRSSADSTAQ